MATASSEVVRVITLLLSEKEAEYLKTSLVDWAKFDNPDSTIRLALFTALQKIL